jgi:hypothetical protein
LIVHYKLLSIVSYAFHVAEGIIGVISQNVVYSPSRELLIDLFPKVWSKQFTSSEASRLQSITAIITYVFLIRSFFTCSIPLLYFHIPFFPPNTRVSVEALQSISTWFFACPSITHKCFIPILHRHRACPSRHCETATERARERERGIGRWIDDRITMFFVLGARVRHSDCYGS